MLRITQTRLTKNVYLLKIHFNYSDRKLTISFIRPLILSPTWTTARTRRRPCKRSRTQTNSNSNNRLKRIITISSSRFRKTNSNSSSRLKMISSNRIWLKRTINNNNNNNNNNAVVTTII